VKKSELRRIIREEIRSLKEQKTIPVSSLPIGSDEGEMWNFLESVLADQRKRRGSTIVKLTDYSQFEEEFNTCIDFLEREGGNVILTDEVNIHIESMGGRDKFKMSWKM
jgi:hypothetical protein